MKAKDLTRYVQAAIIAIAEEKELHIERRIHLYAEADEITCDVTLGEIEKEMDNQLERIKYLFGLFE